MTTPTIRQRFEMILDSINAEPLAFNWRDAIRDIAAGGIEQLDSSEEGVEGPAADTQTTP